MLKSVPIIVFVLCCAGCITCVALIVYFCRNKRNGNQGGIILQPQTVQYAAQTVPLPLAPSFNPSPNKLPPLSNNNYTNNYNQNNANISSNLNEPLPPPAFNPQLSNNNQNAYSYNNTGKTFNHESFNQYNDRKSNVNEQLPPPAFLPPNNKLPPLSNNNFNFNNKNSYNNTENKFENTGKRNMLQGWNGTVKLG